MAADVDGVGALHQRAFPGFFLSFLGLPFLRQLYSGIARDPDGIAFVYEDGGGIRGFVAGTATPSGFYLRLLRSSWWRFALAAIIPAMRRPATVPRLLRAFQLPRESAVDSDTGLLMSIAIDPTCQGQGIGKILLGAFLQASNERGLRTVKLVTDQLGNDGVNRFYRAGGFSCVRQFTTAEGRAMNEYRISLPPLAQAGS